MYSGDPHLMRTHVSCAGSTTPLPVQHCTGNIANLVFASSPTWTVFVDQDDSLLGPTSPSSITAVMFARHNQVLRFGTGAVWPSSAGSFVVSDIMRDERGFDTSATVSLTDASPFLAHVDRTVSGNGTVQFMTVNVCSPAMQAGVGVDGCAPENVLDIVEGRRRLLSITEHPECLILEQPFKDNCNIDLDGVVDEEIKAAIVTRTVVDAESLLMYAAESSLK
jgi:hypothetical protein